MKKTFLRILTLVLIMTMCFSLAACANNPDGSSSLVYTEDGIVIGSANNQNEANTTGGGTGNSTGTGNGNSTGTTPNGTGNNQKPSEIGGEITINKGDTAMDDGLDFGGKTFTLAVDEGAVFHTQSWDAMVKAFEKKYNCKIEKKTLDFGYFTTRVSQQMSTGKSYDVIYFHGSHFPNFAINNLAEDLTSYITTADLVGSNSSTGGINLERSQKFSLNGKLYAVCNNKSTFPMVFYYNKAMFKQYGLEDPRELYEKGQWNWDKIFEMGAQVTDKDKGQYFLGNQFTCQIFGVAALDIEDGKVVERLSSPLFYKCLELFQKVYVGNQAIGHPLVNGSASFDPFLQGKVFMHFEETSKWDTLAPDVVNSFIFNKSLDNLGIVPCPLPAENTSKNYPTGWYQGWAAGTGSDPRVAVAFAKFHSTFNSPVKDKYPKRAEDETLIKELQNGKTTPGRHGAYYSTNKNTTVIYQDMLAEIRSGNDIATTVSNYRNTIISAIEQTVGKGNYVSK